MTTRLMVFLPAHTDRVVTTTCTRHGSYGQEQIEFESYTGSVTL